jgi:Family of unknown function (DUF5682)
MIFGIRHHGPGSSKSLLAALISYAPDCILIEGPPDADHLIADVMHTDMQPPVAMLVYNPKNVSQASFYPFASFSPEWQAMRYGLSNGVPVRFMDLPVGMSHAMRDKEEAQPLQLLDFQEDNSKEDELLRLDPFTRIARLAGFSDSERWWESLIERLKVEQEEDSENPIFLEIFKEITILFTALRSDKNNAGKPETNETLLREAYMRQTMRQAQKDGFQRIAVVCGAWHSPALTDIDKIKATQDAAILKGIKRQKTEATWIPWSYDRLALSGYGAGVISPIWYELLFEKEQNATIEWMTQTARLLRSQGLETSSAHVIEAIRLADTLAVMRRTALPGIEELKEAAKTVLCEGASRSLELIEHRMVIGEVLGKVPDSVPQVPLKADFEEKVRKYRFEKSTNPKGIDISLDLRKDSDLAKSHFLHRLLLLKFQWGKEVTTKGLRKGRFHEDWNLKWQPDYEITLIEAGAWGNTVDEAATQIARKTILESDQIITLSKLLGTTLKADLQALIPVLIQKLQTVSALSKDAAALAETTLPLTEILRYGSARTMDTEAISALLVQIIPRVCVQFAGACTGINEDVAQELLLTMIRFNRAIDLLKDYPEHRENEAAWLRCLTDISEIKQSAPLLAGLAARMLFDKGNQDAKTTDKTMRFRLSQSVEPSEAAMWLEGFLQGSGLILIHHQALWTILDAWIDELPFETLRELLPILRRTFSKFSGPEREQMLALAGRVAKVASVGFEEEEMEENRGEEVLDILRLLLQ